MRIEPMIEREPYAFVYPRNTIRCLLLLEKVLIHLQTKNPVSVL